MLRQTIIRTVLVTGFIAVIFAQWASADRVTEAKLRFEQGANLIKSSEVRKGLNEMLISNRLAPNPNTLLNVARSLEYLRYYEYAYLVYDEYLREDSISEADRKQALQGSKGLDNESPVYLLKLTRRTQSFT